MTLVTDVAVQCKIKTSRGINHKNPPVCFEKVLIYVSGHLIHFTAPMALSVN